MSSGTRASGTATSCLIEPPSSFCTSDMVWRRCQKACAWSSDWASAPSSTRPASKPAAKIASAAASASSCERVEEIS